MKKHLKIIVVESDNEDESLKYHIEISNGLCKSTLDFYGYNDCFQEFAEGLCVFPKTIKDEVIFQAGQDENEMKWAYFLKLKVFCHDVNGDSAIQAIVDNMQDEPYHYRCCFSITTLPASLNDLGKRLLSWNPNAVSEFEWDA